MSPLHTDDGFISLWTFGLCVNFVEVGGAPGGQMIQARCAGARLELLFANGSLPLRNELSGGRFRAALMEINFDDRMVQRLIWLILDRHPTTAIDPFGVGGFIALEWWLVGRKPSGNRGTHGIR